MWYKLKIPLIICFAIGVLGFAQEFVPLPLSDKLLEEVTTWFRIMGGFALFIGAYSLLHMHVSRIRRKQAGWAYSAFVFLGAATMIVFGLYNGGKGPMAPDEPGSLFNWFYDYVQVPAGATIFSILAFFMASAAFRTFRARNLGATLLLISAIVVMFGRVPISEAIGLHVFGRPNMFSQAADALMEFPNLAAKRGIILGISLGAISQSLRILFGIERAYLGGSD